MHNRRIGGYGVSMFILGAGMLLGGCADNTTVTAYGSVAIFSEPDSAMVVNLRGGAEIGSTPLVYTWENEERAEEYIHLLLTAPGYTDRVGVFFLRSEHENRDDAEKNPVVVKVSLE